MSSAADAVPAATAEAGGYLVVEREGRLWGIAGGAIHRLGRRDAAGALRLSVEGGELAAERVLAMVPDLAVRPAPGSLGRYWPEAARGLAVYDGRPLVVIDPRYPPRLLLDEEAAAG